MPGNAYTFAVVLHATPASCTRHRHSNSGGSKTDTLRPGTQPAPRLRASKGVQISCVPTIREIANASATKWLCNWTPDCDVLTRLSTEHSVPDSGSSESEFRSRNSLRWLSALPQVALAPRTVRCVLMACSAGRGRVP